MPHRRAEAVGLIRRGVQLLLDIIQNQQDENGSLKRIILSYEMTEREDKEKIGKMRQTIRAQQASLQNEQPKD